MLFILLSLVFIIVSMMIFKRFAVRNPCSKGILLAFFVTAVVAICLAQNDTQSQIPGAADGIGISNSVAYWIIGEDGWTADKFRNAFENAIYFALFLIFAYPVVVAVESKPKRK